MPGRRGARRRAKRRRQRWANKRWVGDPLWTEWIRARTMAWRSWLMPVHTRPEPRIAGTTRKVDL